MIPLRMAKCATMVLVLALAGASAANDRLPSRLRAPYRTAIGEVRNYVRFILQKVWDRRLAEARANGAGEAEAQDIADDIVHIVLPHTKRIVDDVLFGTGETHLRLTMPSRGKLVGKGLAGAAPTAKDPVEAARQAVETLGGRAERDLHDQIEQALVEDLDNLAQKHVEHALRLAVRGRSRAQVRKLTSAYESRYAGRTRPEIHRFAYWWLRRKKRNELTQLAASLNQRELDRARHRGAIWGLTSNVSREAWSMIRLDIDFQWGRPNWEIDRRRIRRRIDQDLAQGTWALAKLVKELTSLPTLREADAHLARRLREELSKKPLREKAEQYPVTRQTLQKELERLEGELDPIFNRAMARVTLPPDMKPRAEEHGRRYMHEGYRPKIARAIDRQAAPIAAARRVGEQLPALVGASLRVFDDGGRAGGWRRRAVRHVKKGVAPAVDEEIESTLRDSGLEGDLKTGPSRRRAVKRVWRRFDLDRSIERETLRQLGAARRGE